VRNRRQGLSFARDGRGLLRASACSPDDHTVGALVASWIVRRTGSTGSGFPRTRSRIEAADQRSRRARLGMHELPAGPEAGPVGAPCHTLRLVGLGLIGAGLVHRRHRRLLRRAGGPTRATTSRATTVPTRPRRGPTTSARIEARGQANETRKLVLMAGGGGARRDRRGALRGRALAKASAEKARIAPVVALGRCRRVAQRLVLGARGDPLQQCAGESRCAPLRSTTSTPCWPRDARTQTRMRASRCRPMRSSPRRCAGCSAIPSSSACVLVLREGAPIGYAIVTFGLRTSSSPVAMRTSRSCGSIPDARSRCAGLRLRSS